MEDIQWSGTEDDILQSILGTADPFSSVLPVDPSNSPIEHGFSYSPLLSSPSSLSSGTFGSSSPSPSEFDAMLLPALDQRPILPNNLAPGFDEFMYEDDFSGQSSNSSSPHTPTSAYTPSSGSPAKGRGRPKKGSDVSKSKRTISKKPVQKRKTIKSESKAVPDEAIASDIGIPCGDGSLTFSREELLNMSVEEFDARVARIRNTRELTPEEDKDVKRQRRLIKNRESAAASRIRKRNLMDTMETETQLTKRENDMLKKRILELEEENKMLRAQLEHKQFQPITSGFAPQESNNAMSNFWNLRNNSHSSQAGVCLLVVLLSVGFLFTQFDVNNQTPFSKQLATYQPMAVSTFGRVTPSMDNEPLALPGSVSGDSQVKTVFTRRELLQIDDGRSGDEKSATPVVVSENNYVDEEGDGELIILHDDRSISTIESYNPNVTYITINKMYQDGRPLLDSFPEDGSPFMLELIIPPKALGIDAPISPLEITCRVVETRYGSAPAHIASSASSMAFY